MTIEIKNLVQFLVFVIAINHFLLSRTYFFIIFATVWLFELEITSLRKVTNYSSVCFRSNEAIFDLLDDREISLIVSLFDVRNRSIIHEAEVTKLSLILLITSWNSSYFFSFRFFLNITWSSSRIWKSFFAYEVAKFSIFNLCYFFFPFCLIIMNDLVPSSNFKIVLWNLFNKHDT